MTAAPDNTLRIFVNRKSVNKVCRMEGRLPEQENEIATIQHVPLEMALKNME